MYPSNSVTATSSAVALQLDIFGVDDEIPLNPLNPSKSRPPGRTALHDGSSLSNTGLKLVKSIKSTRQSPPKPTLAGAQQLRATDELLVDPDEPISVDLEAVEASDTPETILAKRMFLRMMWDIEGKSEDPEPDLFGQVSVASKKTNQSDLNRLDALVWLYSLNPDGSLVTIEWVCDVLGFDTHRVRRIVGRSLRKELKRLVLLLSTIVGAQHAQVCEEKISDYLDISNWSMN